MSSALGIAAALRVIAKMLDDGVAAAGLSGVVGSAPTTVLSPDQLEGGGAKEGDHLNLFLYLVALNSGWKNVNLPTRGSGGFRLDRPPLAVDLHFLLSGYGSEEYHQEIVLGVGMQVLHETPFLDRAAIDAAFVGASKPADVAMATAGLSDQVELVKIAPHDLSADELYKLWNAFGSKARPSAAYVASVVLIDSTAHARTALPVTARNLAAIPYLRPRIEAVDPAVFELDAGPTTVRVLGSGLSQPGLLVAFGNAPPVAPATVKPARLHVVVPTTLYAGVVGVTAVQTLTIGEAPDKTIGRSTPAYCIIRPAVTSVSASVSGGSGTITVQARPAFDPTAPVDLLLDTLPGLSAAGSYTFTAPARSASGASVSFTVSGVAAGTYLVRIRCGGAESLPTSGADGTFNGPTVTV